ncbi:MAG: PD40 domain-containing protein [Bacteroidetes bacterium]|nr:PD40 domain-containing protein [Bacteroidota bacterium]
MMKNKILYIAVSFIFLIGCSQQSKTQSAGNQTGETKSKKSDSTQTHTNEPGKINVTDLPKFKMTFEREGGVNIINSDLSKERFLYNGHDNLISPDGSKVVHTQSNTDGSRNIAIYDVESKTTKVLSSITGKQNFDAAFSPDGKTIVFCNFSGKKWNIALVNIDDTGFKILTESYKTDLFCPTFAPDGNSILCQDMQSFIEIDLKGKVLKTVSLKDIVGDKKIYFSSANRGYFINNKKRILFDADTGENFETSREPISNIYTYDLETKTLVNLSDNNISTYDPFPLSNGKQLLFSAYTKDDLSKSPDPRDTDPVITSWIYIMNLDGTGKTKLVQNAFEPSASKLE